MTYPHYIPTISPPYPHYIPVVSLLYPIISSASASSSLHHYIITSLHHYIITSLHRYIVTSSHHITSYHIITSSHHHIIIIITSSHHHIIIIIISIIIISPLFTTFVCQSPLYTYIPMKISPFSLVQRKNTSQLPCRGPAPPPPRLWASFPSRIPAWRRSPTAQRSWAQRSKNWEGTRSPLADANFQDMGVSINGATPNSWMVYKEKSQSKMDDVLGYTHLWKPPYLDPPIKCLKVGKLWGKVLSSYHISFLGILQESRYRYTMSCNLPMYWQLNGRKTLSLLNNQPVGKQYGHFTDEWVSTCQNFEWTITTILYYYIYIYCC